MEENDLNVITLIMAAGKGTRMKSNKSKLVQKIYDKELVKRVVELAEKIGSNEIIAVVRIFKRAN
jgi:bifunctional UDP-N-acetylglucosamine pyrophosphorylase/glucosamine-1-phosphate N-acetyltransferase